MVSADEYRTASGLPENMQGIRSDVGRQIQQQIESKLEEIAALELEYDADGDKGITDLLAMDAADFATLSPTDAAAMAMEYNAAIAGGYTTTAEHIEFLRNEIINLSANLQDILAKESAVAGNQYVVGTSTNNNSITGETPIQRVMSSTDNVRFDVSSAEIFAQTTEENAGDSVSIPSYSPYESLGIIVNRPKILLVSDYDLGLYGDNQEITNAYDSSFSYSLSKHQFSDQFYGEHVSKNLKLLSDLEAQRTERVNLCRNSINYIQIIDEFKSGFIDKIENFKDAGLQILGYLPGMNATTAIRQAFRDISHMTLMGGPFLPNALAGVFETADGLSDPDARILPTAFNPQYEITPHVGAHGNDYFYRNNQFYEFYRAQELAITFNGVDPFTISRGDYNNGKVGYRAALDIEEGTATNSCDYFFTAVPHEISKTFGGCLSPNSEHTEGVVDLFVKMLNNSRAELGDSPAAALAFKSHSLYYALMQSYIINSNGLQDSPGKGEEHFDRENNILKAVLGDASTAVPLAAADNSTGLAKILKYRQAGTSVYPFERPSLRYAMALSNTGAADTGEGDAASGLEVWFDKNIGNILEERAVDYRGLETFVDDFENIIESTKNTIKPFSTDGHGQLFINEVLRALRDFYTGDLNEYHYSDEYSALKGGGGLSFDENYAQVMEMINLTDPTQNMVQEQGDSDNVKGSDHVDASHKQSAPTDDDTTTYYVQTKDNRAIADAAAGAYAAAATSGAGTVASETTSDNNCFVAGTMVTAIDSEGSLVFKEIENILVGDLVLSYNFEKKELEPKPVVALMSPIHDDIVEFVFSNGTSTLHTFDHPYYVKSKGWASFAPKETISRYSKESKDLNNTKKIQIGDKVMLDDGTFISILKINVLPKKPVQTYNFSVLDNENYFADSVLVHNKVTASGGSTNILGEGNTTGKTALTAGVGASGLTVQGATVRETAHVVPGGLPANRQALENDDNALIGRSRSYYINKIATIMHIATKMSGLSGDFNLKATSTLLWGSVFNDFREVYTANGSVPGTTDYMDVVQHVFPEAFSLGPPSDFEARAIVIHLQELINAFCSQVEKSMAYNIAVLANDTGTVRRSVGSFSDSTAVSILNTIFSGADLGMLYKTKEPPASGHFNTRPHTTAVPSVNGSPGNEISENAAVHHIHVRHLIIELLADIARKTLDTIPEPHMGFIPGASNSDDLDLALNQLNKSLVQSVMVPFPGEEAGYGLSGNAGDPIVYTATRVLVCNAIINPAIIHFLNLVFTRAKVDYTVDARAGHRSMFETRLALDSALAKMFLPIVDNEDPDQGPVKWKLTYGLWSELGGSLENEEFVNQELIPSTVKTVVEAGAGAVEEDDLVQLVGATEDGETIIDSSHVDNFVRGLRSYYNFVLNPEDLRPYTFVDDKELPAYPYSIDPIRGPASSIIKACVFHREDIRRLLAYLDSVLSHYKSAKENIGLFAEDPNTADLIDRSKLPGIEATEVVKYSSIRQTFLRNFLLAEEGGLANKFYKPSSSYIKNTDNFVEILNDFLLEYSHITPPQYDFFNTGVSLFPSAPVGTESERAQLLTDMQDAFSLRSSVATQDPTSLLNKGKIITVGLPAGFIDYGRNSSPTAAYERFFILEQHNNHYFMGEGKSIKPIYRIFWPSLFINRAELLDAISQSGSYTALTARLKYGYVNAETGEFVITDFETLRMKIDEIVTTYNRGEGLDQKFTHVDWNAETIIFNHVLDALLKLYLDLYGGINTSESSFSVNPMSNVLYVDPITLENLDVIINFVGIDSADHILDDNMIVPFEEFYDRQVEISNIDQAHDIYTSFVCITQSRLFSADQMCTKVIVPNIFDRTFNIYTHMAQLIQDAGGTTAVFDLEDELSHEVKNSIQNDYNSQVYFKGMST